MHGISIVYQKIAIKKLDGIRYIVSFFYNWILKDDYNLFNIRFRLLKPAKETNLRTLSEKGSNAVDERHDVVGRINAISDIGSGIVTSYIRILIN